MGGIQVKYILEQRKKRSGVKISSRLSALLVALLLVLHGAQAVFGQEKGELQLKPEMPELNMKMPIYLKGGVSRNDYSGVKVTMPEKIGLQGHPRLYMDRAELVKWREDIQKTERGRSAFKSVVDFANGFLSSKIVLPDPKVPAQAKDRGDAAAKAHNRLSNAAGRLGWAYQLSDNEAFAEKAREILVGYAKLYPGEYTEHKGVNPHDAAKVMSQRLSEAMWLLPLIQTYDMIYYAKCMTDADRKLIESDLLRAAITFINGKHDAAAEVKQKNSKNSNWRTEEPASGGSAMGNWVNFYNATFVQAGIVLGDKDWIDLGAAGTRLMIARGIGDDGMWKEGAIGYQYFARMALILCMEPLARQGIDVYSTGKARVKNLFDSVYKYAYPDGTMPGINDSGRANVGGDYMAGAYDFGWLRFRDPNYGGVVNAAPRQIMQSEGVYFPTVIYEKLPEQPLQGLDSVIFDGLGFSIMRGFNNGDPTYILLKTGLPTGGPHDHPDNLNLIIFADGDELCGEPAFFRYEDNKHGEWTKTTLGHYSLAVDEHNQAKCTARLTGFYDAGAVKIMRGQCAGAYPDVALDRTVVQMPDYIVDVYQAWGKKSHTFDYPLSFPGELDKMKGVAAEKLKSMGTQPGYKLFMTLDPVTVNGNWSGIWKREAAAGGKDPGELKVTVLENGETKSFCGIGADDRQKAVLRRTGTSAVFTALIEPFKVIRAVKAAENFSLKGPVPGYGLKVTRVDGGTDLIIVRLDPQKNQKPAGVTTFEGGTTDALVSVVRMDNSGKVIEAGFIGGTKLTGGGKTLTSSEAGIKWEK